MNKEWIILAILWIVCLLTLLLISKGRARLTQITFLFTQAISWLFVFILVFFGLVEFPLREFKISTKMNFSLHYLIFPTVGVLFIRFYPKQPGKLKLLLYFLFFSMLIPTFSLLAEKYSNLVRYLNWNWSVHVLANLILLYILAKFIFWFQNGIENRE
jgi:hypothetical protein